MGDYRLNKVLFPSSVAVFGGAGDQGFLGRRIIRNLVADGYKGRVRAVFPDADEIEGLAVLRSPAQAGDSYDLAVLAVPFPDLLPAVRACAEAQIGFAVIPNRSPRIPEPWIEIAAEARRLGVRLVGPGSWGVVSPWSIFNGGSADGLPPSGRLAVISQSASVCASLIELSKNKNIGLSVLVGLGSMIDLDCADIIDYLANHFRVGAILVHAERLPAPRRFMSAMQAASRVKPIAILKTGRSFPAGSVAATPTGALISEDGAFDAAFRRAGIVRVETVADLFDWGDLVGKQPRPKGPGLAVISNVRSPAIMALDAVAAGRFEPASLTGETRAALNGIQVGAATGEHYIRLESDAPPEAIGRLIRTCLEAEEIEGLLVIVSPYFLARPDETARQVAEAVKKKAKPVLTVWMGGRSDDPDHNLLQEAGLPIYDSPERAVHAFLYLHKYDYNLGLLQEIPPRLSGRFAANRSQARESVDRSLAQGNNVLTELESLNLLAAYDLPIVRSLTAADRDEAVRQADIVGYPACLKAVSRKVINKAAARAVLMDLRQPDEVAAAFDRIIDNARHYRSDADVASVLVQPKIARPDFELRLGIRQVPPFGPVILFGQGEVRPEVSTDFSLGLPPLNRTLARRIIERTRVFKLLRAQGRADAGLLPMLEELLVNLSHLASDFPEISELEINPLLVTGEEIRVTDARIILEPTNTPAPWHLIISPYPDEYETTSVIKTGRTVFIRPIKPEDAPMLQELWETLSPRTIYYRFSRPVAELTPEMLIRFTQIDYDREIALVAIDRSESRERIQAVARLTGEPGANLAEFSIVVGDPWHGQGVGAALMTRLLVMAYRRKSKKFWGLVLRENRVMIDLAKKIGCRVIHDEDPSQVEVSMDLTGEVPPEILEALAEFNQQ